VDGSAGGEAGAAGADAAGGEAGAAGADAGDAGPATTLSLPQFVHGAARVNTAAFAQIPLVIGVAGAMPDAVSVAFDGQAPSAAVADGTRFLATVDAKALGNGTHALAVAATSGGKTVATAQGSLVVAADSLQLTEYAKVGPAITGHLVHDAAGDRLGLTWVSIADGKQHRLYLNYFDGAFRRLIPDDVVISDPADTAFMGYSAFAKDSIGVVYRTPKPNASHWLIKMRVVDLAGKEKVAAMDLTAGGESFSQAQIGMDPGGFSAAWLHISPPPDGGSPLPPVEIRWARWDTAGAKLVGPIKLDSDQPAPAGSSQGTLRLEPLAEIGIACNAKVCVVAYSRNVYNALVDLNVPKLHLAVVDLAGGALSGTPEPVEDADWDTQMFGQHLVALEDGTFVLVYTANDTAAAITPKSKCDETMERDLLYAVRLDANGKPQGVPKPIFDHEGPREYPRVAPLGAGFAMFWEDQRSHCAPNGHIRMAASVAGADFSALLDPYLETPGSIALPPMYPTLAVTGTSFVHAWTDNRHGLGLVDPKPELFLDTYWRK
jgi:hypothetical protein